jgi:hypothetical protein
LEIGFPEVSLRGEDDCLFVEGWEAIVALCGGVYTGKLGDKEGENRGKEVHRVSPSRKGVVITVRLAG